MNATINQGTGNLQLVNKLKDNSTLQETLLELLKAWALWPHMQAKYYVLRDKSFPEILGADESKAFFDFCKMNARSVNDMGVLEPIKPFLTKCCLGYGELFQMSEAFSESPSNIFSYYTTFNDITHSVNISVIRNDGGTFDFSLTPASYMLFLSFLVSQIPKVEKSFGVQVPREGLINALKEQSADTDAVAEKNGQ